MQSPSIQIRGQFGLPHVILGVGFAFTRVAFTDIAQPPSTFVKVFFGGIHFSRQVLTLLTNPSPGVVGKVTVDVWFVFLNQLDCVALPFSLKCFLSLVCFCTLVSFSVNDLSDCFHISLKLS